MQTIVVGSGLLGITTAYFLNQNGHDVSVIDSAEGPALATSFANGGLLTPSMAEPWNAPGVFWDMLKYLGREDAPLLFRLHALPSLALWGMKFIRYSNLSHFRQNIECNVHLAQYTLQLMRELRKDITLSDYDGSTRGALKVFRDQQSFDKAMKLTSFMHNLGIEYQQLDAIAVTKLEPALKPIQAQLKGGIYYPSDESGDAHLFCRALAQKAQDNGVDFQYGVLATKLNHKKGRIDSIDSSDGRLTADNFVLCAGVYSPHIARTAGIHLPVKPCKGYSLSLPFGTWSKPPKIPVIDYGFHAAMTPLGKQLRVAGTAEFAGYDATVNPLRIQNLFELVKVVYPEFTPYLNRENCKEWAGLRPVSADGRPIMGATRYSNLYLNTGHAHLGWTMAAGAGKAVADLITDNKSKFDLKSYHFPRVY